MLSEDRIDSWRQRVPSRLDRDDPFEGDGFGERPATRLTFREASPPQRRPSTRMSLLRAATPLFGRSSTPSSRPASGMTERRADSNRRGLLNLMSRKRKRKEQEVEIPREPVRLNFLFVGSKSSGQTSLLFRSRYGYFPHSDAFASPLYETYVNDRVYHNQPWHRASNNGFAKSANFEPLLYLAGLKKDLRDQCFLDDHQTSSGDSSSELMAYPTCCVCPSEASWQAMRIGAQRYVECSAATGEGMKDVIDGSARDTMRKIVGAEWLEDEVVAPKKKRRFF
ncbi:hypothetical protein NW768_004455 [Fusarium equiseti]|uniref:P-loop containing nucleoside triphosphate hydrolase protein n=1 Tax=Fusarium equiseti TaxID=61235 RepID=A0ABQ8RG92_FUSEQ|nr:hypothetical protein NW768_004455 [Fusarium equiseti]